MSASQSDPENREQLYRELGRLVFTASKVESEVLQLLYVAAVRLDKKRGRFTTVIDSQKQVQDYLRRVLPGGKWPVSVFGDRAVALRAAFVEAGVERRELDKLDVWLAAAGDAQVARNRCIHDQWFAEWTEEQDTSSWWTLGPGQVAYNLDDVKETADTYEKLGVQLERISSDFSWWEAPAGQ